MKISLIAFYLCVCVMRESTAHSTAKTKQILIQIKAKGQMVKSEQVTRYVNNSSPEKNEDIATTTKNEITTMLQRTLLKRTNATSGPWKDILFSVSKSGIYRLSTDKSEDPVKTIANQQNMEISFFDYDPITQQIFFVEYSKSSICYLKTAHVNGTDPQTIDQYQDVVARLSVDWFQQKILVAGANKIRNYNLHTFKLENFISVDDFYIYDISVDIFNSVIYWTSNSRSCSYIRRSNYDGSNMEILMRNPGKSVISLVVDYPRSFIYFAARDWKSIYRMNMHYGSDQMKMVNKDEPLKLRSISMQGDYLLWSSDKTIFTANKYSGLEEKTVYTALDTVNDLMSAHIRKRYDNEYENLDCPRVARCFGFNYRWICLQTHMICDGIPQCYGEFDEMYCCYGDTYKCSNVQELYFVCRQNYGMHYDFSSLEFVQWRVSPFSNIFRDTFLSFQCSLEISNFDDNSLERKINVSHIQRYHILRQLTGSTVFRVCDNTSKITMSGNLPCITKEAFKPFFRLSELVLHDTNLQHIGKRLSIQQNEVTQNLSGIFNLPIVYVDAFQGLDNLYKLRISDNKVLRIIDSNAFHGLENLRTLEIKGNENLGKIKINAFEGLQNLRVLLISENSELRNTNEYVFTNLSSLENITLPRGSFNKLTFSRGIPSFKVGNFFTETIDELLMLQTDIEHITGFFFGGIENLKTLTISENFMLSAIRRDAFSGLKFLLNLTISNNLFLKTIERGAFDGLDSLINLTISNQYSLSILADGLLHYLKNLEVIDLRKNNLHLTSDIFELNNKLTDIYTDSFFFCCIKPHIILNNKCHAPEDDDVSSCSDLIADRSLRTCLWEIGIIAFLGNIAVLLYRFTKESKTLKHTFSIFVINLGLSDAFMGLYMLIIGLHDSLYEGEYVWHDYHWKRSVLCKVSGSLAFISSESSIIFISLITMDRLLAVKYPTGEKRISLRHAHILSATSWIASILLATIPVLIYPEFYSYSGTCIALPLTGSFKPGWQISVGIFLGFNCILFIMIAIGQFCILSEIKQSAKRSGRKRSSKEREAEMLLLTVAITDGLCWFPVGIMVMIALAGVRISREIYAWIIVFVLPVNSAINPFLYTFVPLCRKKCVLQPSELKKSAS